MLIQGCRQVAHGRRAVAPDLAGGIRGGRVPTLYSTTAGSQAGRVAELVVWLASERAAGVNGAFYPVEATEPVTA